MCTNCARPISAVARRNADVNATGHGRMERGSPGGHGVGRDRDIVRTGKNALSKNELPRYRFLSMRPACFAQEIEFVRNFVPELTFPLIKTYFYSHTFDPRATFVAMPMADSASATPLLWRWLMPLGTQLSFLLPLVSRLAAAVALVRPRPRPAPSARHTHHAALHPTSGGPHGPRAASVGRVPPERPSPTTSRRSPRCTSTRASA